MDTGHYESEQFTPEIFYEIIKKKFTTFAIHLSKINTKSDKFIFLNMSAKIKEKVDASVEGKLKNLLPTSD